MTSFHCLQVSFIRSCGKYSPHNFDVKKYWYRYGRTECDDEYIGESARTFEERFKEHLKAPSPIYEYDNTTGHKTSVENFKIIRREGHGISRTIQEAIYIRVNNPTLNRNVGKYNLPHIWDKVLFTTPELKIK